MSGGHTSETIVPLVLRCGVCAQELDGLDADRVWTCRSCARAWEVGDDRLVERPFLVWRSGAEGPLVHLPFWRLGHRAEIEGDGDPAARGAVEQAVAAGRSWVRAFAQRGAFSGWDAGQVLTAGDAAERLDAGGQGPLPRCVGARISSGEALRLAELFALAQADRVRDVTPVTLRLVPTEAALVAVPFVPDGPDLVCAVAAARLRCSALADAHELVPARGTVSGP